ncbi:MAG: hypothetical protein IT338_08045 [Thermomicrobiales bacterium]|nr:hypothetical protein [Thermomicrobiales bacterium]
MSAEQGIQIVGALLILAGFVLSQMDRLDPRSYAYLLVNLIGGAILAILAFQGRRWGFVLLEGVWTFVALGGLIQRARGKAPAGGH